MARSQKELDALLAKLNGVAQILHLDVVDGKFAPSHSLDFNFKLPRTFRYNAHLMIKNPEKWIAKHGNKIKLAIPQVEEVKNIKKYIRYLGNKKKKIAFALNPETTVKAITPYMDNIDSILLLTVHPGFYGSPFLKAPLRKIKQIKKINPRIKIIVDGHMNPKTIGLAKKAGADLFVSGSFVSQSTNPRKALAQLKAALR